MNLLRPYKSFAKRHGLALVDRVDVDNLLTSPISILHDISSLDEILVYGFIDTHEIHASIRTVEKKSPHSSTRIRLSLLSLAISSNMQFLYINEDLLDSFRSSLEVVRSNWIKVPNKSGVWYCPKDIEKESIEKLQILKNEQNYCIEGVNGELNIFRLPVSNDEQLETMLNKARDLAIEIDRLFVST